MLKIKIVKRVAINDNRLNAVKRNLELDEHFEKFLKNRLNNFLTEQNFIW